MEHLLNQIYNICRHHREISRLSGDDFNIFRIIRVTTDEVRVHSAFLAELLNPAGVHGQGSKFLHLFTKAFDINNFNCDTASVEIEKSIKDGIEKNNGRIDIFISDKEGHNICIENKINAIDQDEQLVRYHKYNNQNLFYLTLDGKEASLKSAGLLCVGKDYRLLSYQTDILNWLEECRKESVINPILSEGITHYINLIKYLTNQSTNRAMKEEIEKMLLKSPENLSAAIEIANNMNDVKAEILFTFLKEIENCLNHTGLIIEPNTITKSKVQLYFNNYSIKNKGFGLRIKVHEISEHTMYWVCAVHKNLFTGFTIENNDESIDCNDNKYYQYREYIFQCDEKYRQVNDTKNWLGWQYTRPQLNFYEFKSEDIIGLTNKSFRDKIARDIAEKALRDINEIKTLIASK